MPSLTLQILLDNNTVSSSFEFYPGEDRELRAQVIEVDTDQQFPIPELGRTLNFILPGNPDNLEIADSVIEVDTRNSSIVFTELSETTTDLMTSGNLRLIMNYYDKSGNPDLSAYTTTANAKLTVDATDYDLTSNGDTDGTFGIADTTGLSLNSIGTISGDSLDSLDVVITSFSGTGPYTVVVEEVTLKTRMAQIKNAMKRLTPNPTI